MRDFFKGYYQPTEVQFKEMWEQGTFIFDTNVLLNLYRYKKESRDEIIAVIEGIKDRVWIPYQVGLEFHRNRLSVLAEQNAQVATIKSSIQKSIGSLEAKCKELDLDKRHSEIETASFMERFRELSESVQQELSEIDLKKLNNNEVDDSVLTNISAIFNSANSSLGSPPEDQKVLEEIYKDGDFRAKNKIPPSFEDINEAKKNKSGEDYYAFEGLHYKKGYGDLIVWNQIIEYARETKKKSIVFITDDRKEDWMRVINSHGKKTISARPELVSEIFKEAGVESFYIYDTDGFLNYSKEYLEIKVSDEALKDVKNNSFTGLYFNSKDDSYREIIVDSAKVQDDCFMNPFGKTWKYQCDNAMTIIEYWLKLEYFEVKQTFKSRYDFLGLKPHTEVPITVSFSQSTGFDDIPQILHEILSFIIIDNRYKKHHIVLVYFEQSFNDELNKDLTYYKKYIKLKLSKLNYKILDIRLTVGIIDYKENEFILLNDFDI